MGQSKSFKYKFVSHMPFQASTLINIMTTPYALGTIPILHKFISFSEKTSKTFHPAYAHFQ